MKAPVKSRFKLQVTLTVTVSGNPNPADLLRSAAVNKAPVCKTLPENFVNLGKFSVVVVF